MHGQRIPSSAVHICRTFAPLEPAPAKVLFGWVDSASGADSFVEGTTGMQQSPWKIYSDVDVVAVAAVAVASPVGVDVAWWRRWK